MSDQTDVQVRAGGDKNTRVVKLSGEINLRSAPALRERLIELLSDRPGRVVLDLSALTHMDSSGLGTLVDYKRRVENAGGTLVLAGLQRSVSGLMEITKLNNFFTIVPSVEQAPKS